MANVIGELATLVSMRTAPFEKGSRKVRSETAATSGALNRLKRPLGQVTAGIQRMGGAFSALPTAAGPVGALMGIGAGARSVVRNLSEITSGLNRQAEAIDEIGKLSSRTGFGTEAIAAFQFGAQKAGLDVAKLNKSLDIFNRTMGKAFQGTGEGVQALETLGITLDSLVPLSAEQRLNKVAAALAAISDKATQAAVGSQLFGREGSGNMLNFLADGSEGLQQMIVDAESLGIALDGATVKVVERYNDALTTLKERQGGIARQMTAELIPQLLAAVEMTEQLEQSVFGGPAKGRTIGQAIVAPLGAVAGSAAGPGGAVLGATVQQFLKAKGSQTVEQEREKLLRADLAASNKQLAAAAALQEAASALRTKELQEQGYTVRITVEDVR